MKLIADSGSTKTDWALVSADGDTVLTAKTQGINPIHQKGEAVADILRDELLPAMPAEADVTEVYFYGSGLRPEYEQPMCRLLSATFSKAVTVEAHSDMLGAARALLGHDKGVAAILGTGANSCLYDGEKIVGNTPAMGYILGDEGSGAVLGRELLRALYKGQLPAELLAAFEQETGLSLAAVIERVYRQPLANRFLASLTMFISRHIDAHPVLSELVTSNFQRFFLYNIAPYGQRQLPVCAVGSIASVFAAQLAEAARREGFRLGTTLRSPLDGLVKFH